MNAVILCDYLNRIMRTDWYDCYQTGQVGCFSYRYHNQFSPVGPKGWRGMQTEGLIWDGQDMSLESLVYGLTDCPVQETAHPSAVSVAPADTPPPCRIHELSSESHADWPTESVAQPVCSL